MYYTVYRKLKIDQPSVLSLTELVPFDYQLSAERETTINMFQAISCS